MILDIPTTLSEDKNQEFRALYKKHYSMDLSIEEANAEAYRLLSFGAIVFKYGSD